MSDQTVQVIVGAISTVTTAYIGYLLKKGQKQNAETVQQTAENVKGEMIQAANQAAVTVKEKQDITDKKVDRIDKAVNGMTEVRDRHLEHKRKENRVLYGEIQRLREALLAAGIEPPKSELRVGPVEGDDAR